MLRHARGKNDSKRRSRFHHGPLTFSYALLSYCSLHVTLSTQIIYREWVPYLKLLFCQHQRPNVLCGNTVKGVESCSKDLYLRSTYQLKKHLHFCSTASWKQSRQKKGKRKHWIPENSKKTLQWYVALISLSLRGGRKMCDTSVSAAGAAVAAAQSKCCVSGRAEVV